MLIMSFLNCFILITLLLFGYTNCGDGGLGPTVEIDVSEQIYYKAVEPNYPEACIEIQIPFEIDKQDIKREIISILDQNNFDDQVNSSVNTLESQLGVFGIASPFSATQDFESNNIVVSDGRCPAVNADPISQGCTKRIAGIPFKNYYRLMTYVEVLNPFPNLFQLHPILHNSVCPSL